MIHDRLGTPRCLYKYLPRKYAEALVSGASIRIGTLHEFREMEDADPRRGDKEEGIYTHCEYIGDGTLRKDRGLSPRASRVFGIPEDSGATVQFLTVKETIAHRNVYMYCTSMECSLDVMREFEGDNCCVRINAPERFFEAIYTHLVRSGITIEEPGMQRVWYGSREHFENVVPRPGWAVTKPLRYASQREYRMLWGPSALEIEPLIFSCRRAGRFCEIVEMPPPWSRG